MEFRRSNITTPLTGKWQEHSRWDVKDVAAAILARQRVLLRADEQNIGIKPRHLTLAARPKCAFCDLPGVVFIVCRVPQHNGKWHLHLFGERNGQLVMMTIDHIVPKSLGGKDHPNNFQTACLDCNCKKGDICTDPFAAAKLRHEGLI